MSARIYSTTTKRLEVPRGGLQPGDVYVFALTVAKENRASGFTSVKITAVAGDPPVVSIVGMMNDVLPAKGKVNPNKRLVINGDIEIINSDGESSRPRR
jgi:hypothetical protein